MKIETAGRKLVQEFRARPTLRAGSLITTVFGDAIAPRGGKVWMGSLIRAMACFGISERLVRTSVFRLVGDGWLQSEQIGRRSYYCLTEIGRERFQHATQRIYGVPRDGWDGKWCLLLLSGLETAARETVRREFAWLGFAPLSANLLAHPSPNTNDLDATCRRLDVAGGLVVLEGQTIRNAAQMRRLAHASWNIGELDAAYEEFVARFRPVIRALQKSAQVADETAFIVRTLMIQEYRKILLRDPMLAVELLPANWHGSDAYQLCGNVYRSLHREADAYITRVMETADGALPAPDFEFQQRFGGLDELPVASNI